MFQLFGFESPESPSPQRVRSQEIHLPWLLGPCTIIFGYLDPLGFIRTSEFCVKPVAVAQLQLLRCRVGLASASLQRLPRRGCRKLPVWSVYLYDIYLGFKGVPIYILPLEPWALYLCTIIMLGPFGATGLIGRFRDVLFRYGGRS